MAFWLVLATAGLLLSLGGLCVVVREYQRGLLTDLEAALLIGSYIILLGVIAIGELADQDQVARGAGSAVFIVLVPVWFYVLQRAQRRRET